MKRSFESSAAALLATLALGIGAAAYAQDAGLLPPADPMMAAFDKMDADKDGKLTEAEITAYKAALFAEADTSKDGKLSPEELLAMHEKATAARKLAQATEMAKRLDGDGDGQISMAELDKGPRPIGAFDKLDTDGDGAVSKAELEAAREAKGKGEGMGKGEGHGKGHKGDGKGEGKGHGKGEGMMGEGMGGPEGGPEDGPMGGHGHKVPGFWDWLNG